MVDEEQGILNLVLNTGNMTSVRHLIIFFSLRILKKGGKEGKIE